MKAKIAEVAHMSVSGGESGLANKIQRVQNLIGELYGTLVELIENGEAIGI